MNELELTLATSRRFKKAYRRSSVGLRGVIAGCVRDALSLARAEPKTFAHHYDRVAHLRKQRVLELKVSGGNRLLAHWSNGCLKLLDVGGHDIVTSYTSDKLIIDQAGTEAPPDEFWPEHEAAVPFFSSYPSLVQSTYGPENHPDWLYFLSAQQQQVADSVLEYQLSSEHTAHPSIILGGPGTGKTVILLNLLRDFCEFEERAYLAVSARVAKYVLTCLPRLLPERIGPLVGAPSDLTALLIDDPHSLGGLDRSFGAAAAKGCEIVVVGLDPCQLRDAVRDEEFDDFVDANSADLHTLDVCYRQKANVGKSAQTAMRTVAESTPFLDAGKVKKFRGDHRALTDIANDLRFENPGGYVRIHEENGAQALQAEVHRIRSHVLWDHWPPLLVVLENPQDRSWTESCEDVNHDTCSLPDVLRIKGLEYQHVFLFLTRALFEQVQHGFEGLGKPVYTQRRLLRIPYSRAKDSFVVFVSD
jgi:hypothetical protein